MKIRLAIIPPDKLMLVKVLTGDLRLAVNSGDMDGVDAATERLLALTAKMRSADITEKEYHGFLAEVRARNAAFQSDYVVPGEFCIQLFPDATADTMVLQLPFSEQEGDNV